MTMQIVMPDARFDGDAEFEQAVIGDRADLKVFKADTLDDIAPEVWAATDDLGADPLRQGDDGPCAELPGRGAHGRRFRCD